MDECEQLCNRLAIMAKGQLMCIGPVQQLKSTYSKGFIIYIIIENNQPEENIAFIVKEMHKIFESVSLQEAYAVSKLIFIFQTLFLFRLINSFCFLFSVFPGAAEIFNM